MSTFNDAYDRIEAKCQAAMATDESTQASSYVPRFKPLETILPKETPTVKVKAHGFSRKLARVIGIVPALILKFIAYKVYSVRNKRDGKLWYYATYRDIAKQFPYLSPSTINRALQLLEQKHLLDSGNYNRLKRDKTKWYSVSEEVRNQCETHLIYFVPSDAKVVGLKAAVVFYHIQYTLKHKPEVLKDGKWLKVWPSDLAEFQPMSALEAHNGLKRLVEKGYLVKEDSTPYCCHYRLGDVGGDFNVLDSEADPLLFGARPL